MNLFKKITVPDNIMDVFNSMHKFVNEKDYTSLKNLFTEKATIVSTYEANRIIDDVDTSIQQLIQFHNKRYKFKSKFKITEFDCNKFDDILIIRYHDKTKGANENSELKYTEKITFTKNGKISEILYNYT